MQVERTTTQQHRKMNINKVEILRYIIPSDSTFPTLVRHAVFFHPPSSCFVRAPRAPHAYPTAQTLKLRAPTKTPLSSVRCMYSIL